VRPDDIDEALVAAGAVFYCEGYIWDVDLTKEAILKGMGIAARAGGQVALALSDSLCVDRHRAEFLELVDRHVDVLFANETEICALYEVESFDDALQAVRGRCAAICLTRSARGSVVLVGDEVHVIDAYPVDHVVDTTGAGDLYAAGFLHGLTSGLAPAVCGRLGSFAAAEVISHLGARPEYPLAELAGPILA